MYCGNNPANRTDLGGMDSEKNEDLDIVDDDPQELGAGSTAGGAHSGTNGGLWESFVQSLKDGMSGLTQRIRKTPSVTYSESHHFLSNKNSKYTPEYEAITNKYDLSLNGEWNIELIEGHRGRHTNAYHEFMLAGLNALDAIVDDKDTFLYGFSMLKGFVIENNWLPYATVRK